MVNNVILVGPVRYLPEVVKDSNNKSHLFLWMEIERPFRMADGSYCSDLIPVELYRGDAQMLLDHCRKGSWISIKGRLMNGRMMRDGVLKEMLYVFAESIGLVIERPEEVVERSSAS